MKGSLISSFNWCYKILFRLSALSCLHFKGLCAWLRNMKNIKKKCLMRTIFFMAYIICRRSFIMTFVPLCRWDTFSSFLINSNFYFYIVCSSVEMNIFSVDVAKELKAQCLITFKNRFIWIHRLIECQSLHKWECISYRNAKMKKTQFFGRGEGNLKITKTLEFWKFEVEFI